MGFKPGQSGNPAGRPPSRKYLSEALREWLSAPSESDPERTNADSLAEVIGKQALNGDIMAIREICDRAEGRPRQALDVTTTENRGDTMLRDEASRLLAEYTTALNGDEAKAKALLAEDAPTYARYIN